MLLCVRDDDSDALFTLSELSFYHAKESGKRPYYLAAAVYAYAYLFPAGAGRRRTPSIPACGRPASCTTVASPKHSNRRTAKRLRSGRGFSRCPSAHSRLHLTNLNCTGPVTGASPISSPRPISRLAGLNNRYRRPGIGAPLAASTVPLNTARGENDFVAPKVKVPTNLFLRIEQPKQELGGRAPARGTRTAHDDGCRLRAGG